MPAPVDEIRQRADRVENLGGELVVVDLEAEMLLQRCRKRHHGKGIQLRNAAEQRRPRLQGLAPLRFEAETLAAL